MEDVSPVDLPEEALNTEHMSLQAFVDDFGADLLEAVQRQNPPIYQGDVPQSWKTTLAGLLRKPFDAQADRIYALATALITHGEKGMALNGEMGTGKTFMGIALANLLHLEGYPRTLVISPPHLVYKWRREILETVPGAQVWVLNGADTLKKLLQVRAMHEKPEKPVFFILGRVRMRMGFDWRPAFVTKRLAVGDCADRQILSVAACPSCGQTLCDEVGAPLQAHLALPVLNNKRCECVGCGERLWTLTRGKTSEKTPQRQVLDALMQIPTIGEKRADALLQAFGAAMLANMLDDNIHNFINLMDDDGELLFSDRQAKRMERFLGNNEVTFGQGGYQASEFIKRYLPKNYFGLLLVDEGHEYKNEGSAQGQAMGVLSACARKTVLLTGTLMGGYADDLFHLLYRMNPGIMVEDGFTYNERNSILPAAHAFMETHGVLIETRKSSTGESSHRTAKGKKSDTPSITKGPGFGPKGIMRYVVPYTAFLKLSDLGQNVLPPYQEEFISIPMDDVAQDSYTRRLQTPLQKALADAMRAGDNSLMGVVLNVLLAWPDCAFREEFVYHPHRRDKLLASAPVLYDDTAMMPKESKLLEICQTELRAGRRVLVYTTYTGRRDTTARLKAMLTKHGLRTSVLKATVEAAKREDWLADQIDRGVDVIITNPELVKTGLDMLEFPTIVFVQTGYNVYTLQQAARRSWRIGQRQAVKVLFLGYAATMQEQCLSLMGKKVAVSQSTSGDMPESGLDVLNQDGDSIEVAMARQLLAA